MFYFFSEFIYTFILFLTILICILITVAFFTLFERKVLASMQQRLGPNKVGVFGLLQAIADAVKLFSKEIVFPLRANLFLFIFAPLLTFFLSLLSWIVIPFGPSVIVSNFSLSVLFILLLSSINIYGIILSGWASNSRYSFLGALRSSAQMISYELSMGTNILNVVLLSGSLNIMEIVLCQKTCWFFFPLLPVFVVFFICCLAETNRSPFDLPEAESELVSGFNTEHSGFPFALFFLAEYVNILLLCNLIVLFFFGGWLPIFEFFPFNFVPFFIWYFFKVFLLLFIFIWIRATLPRFRYDQLMYLGWKVFLPLSFFFFGINIGLVLLFDGLPPTF